MRREGKGGSLGREWISQEEGLQMLSRLPASPHVEAPLDPNGDHYKYEHRCRGWDLDLPAIQEEGDSRSL